MSRYLVTGGAGFIGSHLTEALLRAGHRVRVLDDLSSGVRPADPAVEFLEGDVADATLVRRAVEDCAGIFHLAAMTAEARCQEGWSRSHAVNLGGTIAVLDAARAAGRIPVCFASSAAIYGEQGPRAIQEAARPRPHGHLGADKLGAEHHAALAFAQHGVPNLGLRIFHAYGPRAEGHRRDVVAIFAERILAGQVITLHGDGQQVRDFVHVSDVVRHFFAGMQMLQLQPQALALNLCTGRGTTLRGLADLMGVVAARVPLVQFGPRRPQDLRALLGDPNEAIHVLGVEAATDLETGLRTLFPAPPPSALEWARRAPMPRPPRAGIGPAPAAGMGGRALHHPG
ncbi:NAD-dependent epimerase/dehydratase family protein [Roseococcus sp. SDR]|uniref:NAD-dependent epimerase/dehydratase family protein n=1 Tax=Roseococcus sp. SDR TaxID=2835532 RepID=UPI001BCB2696|nr:NAD-dependent epimerase/dehydratase family protein [Roseococcus sp. SDR]MBS7790402.1 NAD-dependent epimerase/dehydratase family protein [Roseococcus sp. SDR]MBV1845716.1 NAD-dependent epimerase/dehydratase family protein [Roseococcus sp. SDR]